MKEFVEKLIGRLEELGWVFADYYPDGTAINRKRKKSVAYDDVISIVNQLAEEMGVSKMENTNWIHYGEKLPNDNDLIIVESLPSLYPMKDFEEKALQIVIECAKNECNNGWIPCSERLPKDEELSQRKEVIVQNRYGEIFTAQYTYNCPKTRKDFFKEYCIVPYVIAWMPLPAPYQKGE